MENFKFYAPTNIIFGKNGVKENLLNELKLRNVKKLLITTGGGSIKRNGVYDDIMESLKSSNIEIFEFFGINPNPTLTNVNDAIKIIRDNDIDFILSAGGGSSLDATKAISRGAKIESSIWDCFEGKVSSIGEHIGFGSIITIPATGSEMNPGSVITNDLINAKRSASFAHPEFSFLDPTYTFTLPKWQTGAGASDIVSHVFEQYFTNHDSLITHELMFGVLKTLKEVVPKVLKDESNYDLRSEILWSGTIGFNYILMSGVGNLSFDVHGMEHPLSGFCNITHGAGLAALTPNWMRALKGNERFDYLVLKLGKSVFNTTNFDDTVNEIEKMFISFGMPMSLKEIGVSEELLDICSNDAVNSRGGDFNCNFKNWTQEDILNLYKESM